MNTHIQKILKSTGLIIASIVMMNSCIDNEFETPQPIDIPIGEIYSIADIRQMHAENNDERLHFSEDISIFGVITMDGTSDNIYKNAFIQDQTAAINLRILSPGGLYQGDSVRINLKGTSLNKYQNMLQIDSVHVGNNVIKIKTLVDVSPTPTDIITLLNDPSFQGKLVQLNNVEFHPNDLGTTYADGEKLLSQNRTLRDCNGNEIIVRTSGYAIFADSLLPEGNGSIIGILGQFNNDRQLYIRDLNEVDMDGIRCSQQGNEDQISLAEVRELFNQGATSIPAGKTIIGVITSDRMNLNITGRNAYLQDASGSIALRFSANHTFNQGDRITLFAGTLELSAFNGLLQINNIPNGNASLSETGISIEPQVTTIGNILSNVNSFESRLVRINNVTIASGGTFAGDKTLNDGTAGISLFTRNDAIFAGNTVPEGSFSIVGIVSIFTTPNIVIRNLDDIQQ